MPTDRLRGTVADGPVGFSSGPLDGLLQAPFAHRGLFDPAAGVPENSLPAVVAACRAGFGVEIDVQLTRDGVPVVHHDATLQRMCGVPDRTAEREAAWVTARRLSDTGHRLPTLADCLDAVAGDVPLLLDLKPGWRARDRAALVAAVLDDLTGYDGVVGAVSFDPLVLRLLGDRAPHLARGQSAGLAHAVPLRRALHALTRPLDPALTSTLSRAHLLSFNVDRLPHPAAARWRRGGAPLLGWTVRSLSALHEVRRLVDNVIVEGEAAAHLRSPGRCSACRGAGAARSRSLPAALPRRVCGSGA